FVPRALDHLAVGRAVRARPVADAVVAGEVRRGLRRRDEVVAGHAVAVGPGQVTLPHLGAQLAGELNRLLESRTDAGLDRIELGDLLRHREAYAREGVGFG